MDFGSRQIRTAGKGSGSIEVTLPSDLRDLVGLSCRVMLRDGSRPDIVLQPDLQLALATFSSLWRTMADAMACEQAESSLPLAAFGFGLQPRGGGGDQPFLCWRDGLALRRPPPHEPLAVARTLAAFGHALARPLRIAPSLAAPFGAACGYLAAGILPAAGWQEACDLAAAGLRATAPYDVGAARPHDARPGEIRPGDPLRAAAGAGCGIDGPAFWDVAGPLLSAATDLFLSWTADPAAHTTLRAAWRRGLCIELSGG